VSGLVITGVAAIVNVCAFEVPPPGAGFTTVIDAVPAVATSEAGTVAWSCVDETNVVVRPEPFQFTVAPETNLLPFTVSVNPVLPAVTHVGLIELVTGAGLLIVKVTIFVTVGQPLFIAVRVTEYTPTAVGVPVMSPRIGSDRTNPGGSPVASKLSGLPVAVIR